MSAIRHGNPGEWAKVQGTVKALWPLFICFLALGALGASIFFGRHPAVFAGIFAVLVAATALMWRKGLRRVESYFKGARGEERVAGLLETLPDSWHVFHDLEAGAHHVDHVVVGLTGIYSIETKNWHGRVSVEGGEIVVDGALADRAPLLQAVREADAVKNLLKKAGWNGDVAPVLCFASDNFAAGTASEGRVTIVNASTVVSWIRERPVAMASGEVARLAQLMETGL